MRPSDRLESSAAVNPVRRLASRPVLWTALASLALHLLLFGGWWRATLGAGVASVPASGAPVLQAALVPASGTAVAPRAPGAGGARVRPLRPIAAQAVSPPGPVVDTVPESADALALATHEASGAAGKVETVAEALPSARATRDESAGASDSGPATPVALEPSARPEPEAHAERSPVNSPVNRPAAAVAPPRPPAPLTTGRWQLRVHYGDYTKAVAVASLDYLVSVEGDHYVVRTEGRAEGLASLLYSGVLTQASRGHLGPDGLEPEQFTEQRGKRPERRVDVDRARHRVRFADGTELPTVDGLQDRLSVLLQLGVLARAHPEQFVAGKTVTVPELTWRDIESARYLSHGEVRLPTERGELRTLHLERVGPRRDDDPFVDLWLGYDHGLVPVRIRLTDPGGRVLDQMLVTQP